jgi:hypothetical protein
MRRVAVIVLLSIAVAAAADKDKGHFEPGPASSYPGHQTLDKITIAAVPFLTDAETSMAFGKLNPNKYGILPVLVVLENNTGKVLRLDLQAEFVTADGKHLSAMPPDDVQHLGAPARAPRIGGSNPFPVPLPTRVKKGPLNVWEIDGRSFAAKLVPVGERAYGFFYFYHDHEPGSRLYLTGIKDASTGQDYFYFEVPLEPQATPVQ